MDYATHSSEYTIWSGEREKERERGGRGEGEGELVQTKISELLKISQTFVRNLSPEDCIIMWPSTISAQHVHLHWQHMHHCDAHVNTVWAMRRVQGAGSFNYMQHITGSDCAMTGVGRSMQARWLWPERHGHVFTMPITCPETRWAGNIHPVSRYHELLHLASLTYGSPVQFSIHRL